MTVKGGRNILRAIVVGVRWEMGVEGAATV
jgi:hypothetical protein